jgi:hypothetical protein
MLQFQIGDGVKYLVEEVSDVVDKIKDAQREREDVEFVDVRNLPISDSNKPRL